MYKLLLIITSIAWLNTAIAEEANEPSPLRPMRVELSTGQVIIADSVEHHSEELKLYINNSHMLVAKTLVTTVEYVVDEEPSVNKLDFSPFDSFDPNATRYLYAPNAFMLQKGEWQISQKQLLFTAVSYGINNFLSVQLGSAIPFLFDSDTWNLLGSVKMGYSLNKHNHIAGGVQGFAFRSTTSALPFVTYTSGTPNQNLSLNFSFPVSTASEAGVLLTNISGYKRISEKLGLVTENYYVQELKRNKSHYLIFSGALRIIANQLGIDVGLIKFEEVSIPIPWISFTYNL